MTYYFDNKGYNLTQIVGSFAPGKMPLEVANDMDMYEQRLVQEVSVATILPGFPEDLALKIDQTILKYASACQPSNIYETGLCPIHETAEEHVRALKQMTSEFHDIFHEVAQRRIQGFSDDPLFPIRQLAAQAEERREKLVEKMLAEK